MPIIITAAQRRALQAVRDGKCFRKFDAKGNSLHGPKGIGAAALWHIDARGWIRDRKDRRVGLTIEVVLALTDAGDRVLRQAEEREPRTAAGSLD